MPGAFGVMNVSLYALIANISVEFLWSGRHPANSGSTCDHMTASHLRYRSKSKKPNISVELL